MEEKKKKTELFKCDECGGSVVCNRYEEGGQLDFVGLYKHKCMGCKKVFQESELIPEGHIGCRVEPSRCPICGEEYWSRSVKTNPV